MDARSPYEAPELRGSSWKSARFAEVRRNTVPVAHTIRGALTNSLDPLKSAVRGFLKSRLTAHKSERGTWPSLTQTGPGWCFHFFLRLILTIEIGGKMLARR